MSDILFDIIDFLFENIETFSLTMALSMSFFLLLKHVINTIDGVEKKNTGRRRKYLLSIIYYLIVVGGFYEIVNKVNLISRENTFGYYISFGAAVICTLIFVISDEEKDKDNTEKLEKLYRLEKYCSELEKENEQLNKWIDYYTKKNG